MAAGPWAVYGAAIEGIAKNTIVLDNTGTPRLRMVLVAAAYTPALDTHSAWSSVSANQVSGTGYTANGVLLTPTVTRSGGTVTFDCNDVSWASSTITAKYAVIVQNADGLGTLAATDLLLCYSDLNTDSGSATVSTTNGTFAININASGVFTLARAA